MSSAPDWRTLSSKDFVTTYPRTNATIVLTVIMVVILLLTIYVAIFLISRRPRACTSSPPTPTGVYAGFLNTGAFRVQWNPLPDVDSYTVYVGLSSTFNRSQSLVVQNTSRARADILGLDLGQTYYIIVTSKNNCGESANSPTITYIFVQA